MKMALKDSPVEFRELLNPLGRQVEGKVLPLEDQAWQVMNLEAKRFPESPLQK